MSEYAYRIEYDSAPMVDRIAAQIQHKVDQAALDKIADTLEQYGYVKVVRCRDCKRWASDDCEWNPFCNDPDFDEPDGFCAWASKREGADS